MSSNRPLSSLLVLAACAAASGCGDDPSGPAGPIEVSVTAQTEWSTSVADSVAHCLAYLSVHASEGGEEAAWTDGVFRFHVVGQSAVRDSLDLSRAEVRQIMGQDGIEPGERIETLVLFQIGAPFDVSGLFRFDSDGASGESAFAFRCAPANDGGD